jgi:hypothetical protein
MAALNDRRRRMVTQAVFWGFVAIALFYLLAEHRAHVFGVLPFLLVLACPLMHLFHHGHGGHGSSGSNQDDNASSSDHAAHRHS